MNSIILLCTWVLQYPYVIKSSFSSLSFCYPSQFKLAWIITQLSPWISYLRYYNLFMIFGPSTLFDSWIKVWIFGHFLALLSFGYLEQTIGLFLFVICYWKKNVLVWHFRFWFFGAESSWPLLFIMFWLDSFCLFSYWNLSFAKYLWCYKPVCLHYLLKKRRK